jgi:hypothetical protein
MAEKQLNTIIVLKNDTKAAWDAVKDTATLRVGEIGIESDTGLFKIGKEKTEGVLCTWAELDYANEIPEVDLSTVTNAVQVVDGTVADLEAGKVVGDMAIVRSVISGNIKSYTAYVWNGDAWAAMDGNYDAGNVYFSENVTVTTTVGNITTSNNTPKELQFAGKNLKQIYEYLYAKEDVQIAVTGTSAAISLSKSSDSLEVGSTYTLPTASVSTGTGKYGEYGGKDASGNKISKDTNLTDVKFNLSLKYTKPNGSAVEIATAENATSIAATSVPTANQPTDMTVVAGSLTHTFSGSFTNTASAYKPVTNLGNFVSAINSASATTSPNYADGALGVAARTTAKAMDNKTYTVSGFRKWYRGGDAKSDFSVTTIKGLTASSGAVSGQTFELKAADYTGCSRIVIAIPAASNIKVKEVLLKSSSNADITGEFKQVNTADNVISIGGVNNYDPVAHNVWEYKPAALDSTEVYTITIG